MTFTIEKLPGESIVVLVHQSKNIVQEMTMVRDALFGLLDTLPEPAFVVMDIRGMRISLDDISESASQVALKPDAPLHHPKIRESLLITDDGLIRIAAQGMRTATFGNVKIRAFTKPEDAIAYAREKLAAEMPDSGQRGSRSA